VAERDPEAVLRYIEHYASALVEAGVPRMPARVFAALQCTDSGRLTAAEVAEILQVSPAAVSGAVRYLTQFNLVRREREPGSRRDQYVVADNTWYEAVFSRDRVMARWETSAREGVEVLGATTPAGRRMEESLVFFEFIRRELGELQTRWEKFKGRRA
jgi:DNA-binding transcriptional regulator GbsR (MarR family)